MSTSDVPSSDGALITAVLAGERERFVEIVVRYKGALMRLAFSRLGRSEWAEDGVQETFLCAYKSLHSYDSRYSFRTWLWAILLNQCRRHGKKQARQAEASWSLADYERAGSGPESVSRQSDPLAQLLAKERSELLHAELQRLPSYQADAIRLRFFGGLKYHEIAAAMGCSLSSAKQRVRLGLTKISRSLANHPG